jgi:uncharacterized protein DUF5010
VSNEFHMRRKPLRYTDAVDGGVLAAIIDATVSRRCLVAALAAAAIAFSPGRLSAQDTPDYLNWASPGPYRAPDYADFSLNSFRSDQSIVGTYFFYWFDADTLRASGERFPFNPVDDQAQSFLSSSWYERQFGDMLDAGIDFILPDYWGEPGQYNRRVAPAPERNLFATQGIPPMVEALQRLDQAGRPMKVGLFLDTSILNNEDLTTERGKQIFYATIRDYFSRIPPRYWAAIDGRPIVWLYDAQKVSAFDQSSFDYVYDRFAEDFGGLRPWIVREWQWYAAKNTAGTDVLRTEGLYNWGAAPFGFNPDTRFTVAEVGPGFTSFDQQGPNAVDMPRRGGAYYEDNLRQAVASGCKIMAIETWNELDEGTAIMETREFGRQYIDLTRRYTDLFKAPH